MQALTLSIVCAFLQMPVHFGLGGPSLCCRQLRRFQQAGSLWRNLTCEDWLAKSWQPAMGVFFFFFSLSFAAFALLCLSCYLCWAEWKQSVWALFSKPRKVCEKKVVPRFSNGFLVEVSSFGWACMDSGSTEFCDDLKDDPRRHFVRYLLHSPPSLIEDSNDNDLKPDLKWALLRFQRQTEIITTVSCHYMFPGSIEAIWVWTRERKKLLFVEAGTLSVLDKRGEATWLTLQYGDDRNGTLVIETPKSKLYHCHHLPPWPSHIL